MATSINLQHWLGDDGEPVPGLRRQVLRLARLIESAGPLAIGQTRGTLEECTRRVNRRSCGALLWVAKLDVETIEACCLSCLREHIVITGWQHTEWAAGPMRPIGPGQDDDGDDEIAPSTSRPLPN